MAVKLLDEHHLEFLSLKGGCAGSSKSTLVKMPHCWKSHVVAKNVYFQMRNHLTSTLMNITVLTMKTLLMACHVALNTGRLQQMLTD